VDATGVRARRDEVAMKSRLVLLVGVAAIAAAGLHGAPPADACSSSSETVAISEKHPDLPLSPYVAGHLGVVQPTYARMHLVVAYAWLTGKGLDPAAQKSVLELSVRRLPWVSAQAVVPGLPGRAGSTTPAADPVADWQKERDRIVPRPAAAVSPAGASYTNAHYLTIDNCLEDAFRSARDTLLAREAALGAKSAELTGWVVAQDTVFENCAHPENKAIPATLPPSASATARADRSYQIASAYFYSNQFDEAQKRYSAIAADRASPWAAIAGYMKVRVRVRRANVGNAVADKAELRRALADANTELADASHAAMHPSLRRYRRFVRVGAEPDVLLSELARDLERGGLGADTGSVVDDYTTIVDHDESVLEKASDDATAFVGAMQGKRSFEFAYSRFLTTGADTWTVAALTLAKRADDPRLAPLLARALAIAPGQPAYATARYHTIRLEAARGASAAALSDLLAKTRQGLGSYLGVSTKNAFALLAARTAHDMTTFLREAPLVPAGASEDGGPVVFDPQKKRAIPEALADEMSAQFPLSKLADAALAPTLPRDVRAQVAATTWARANLLADRATAARVARAVGETNPTLRPYVDKVERATSDDERRLAFVHTLLVFPNVGPTVDGWASGEAVPVALSSTSGTYLFCPSTGPAPTTPVPLFLARADRDAAKREAAALTKLGAGATWVALEATRAAKALPKDPRAPEVLHLAVRATRYACKDAKTTDASRAAFQELHRAHAGSKWAKATPYFY